MKPKREIIYVAIIIILVAVCAQFYYSYRYQPQADRDIQVYYNQDRPLNKEIIRLTQDADKFVYFAVYTFTRNDIKDALLAAKYRGLTVVGLTDKDQYANQDLQKKIINDLRAHDIPVYTQNHLGIMHLKVIVTEKGYASGSYNWTSAATNLNDEVLEVGHDENIRKSFQDILEKLFEKYRPVGQ